MPEHGSVALPSPDIRPMSWQFHCEGRRVLALCSLSLCALFVPVACGPSQRRRAERPADVDAERLRAADGDAENWMTHGRTYGEQRFSPLTQITDQNVAQLGLAWSFDLDTRRGQEATPLVIDGVMYFTSAWSKVFALNAANSALLWSYDPKVLPEWAVNA